ncbi:MAG: ABC transporter ATP-binding protein [Verrucomicrobiota bacterium]
MDKLWSLDHVMKAGTQHPRLNNIDLDIRPGITAIMGYSAAGKTSLLNLLAGFEQPDGGRITFEAETGNAPLPLYWAPQNEGLWPHLNAAQHLELVLPDSDASSIDRLLADFDILDRKDTTPDRLSQGERSRLAVARALASGAPILIMDEPLVHVEIMRRRLYWQRIHDHVRERNVSLIFASHQPAEVLGFAERVIFLKRGRVRYDGWTDLLYHQPPDEESAWCLGEINWFDEAEARNWLHRGSHDPHGYRPERLRIEEVESGPIRVETATFHGSLGEVWLRHETTGQARLFYHRPSSHQLRPGRPVRVEVLDAGADWTEEDVSTRDERENRERG